MSEERTVTVVGPAYWSTHVDQLAQLLVTSTSSAIRDPSSSTPSEADVLYLTRPHEWATRPSELHDALVLAVGGSGAAVDRESRTGAGVFGPVESRLVYTVEEAATLLGISRSFAYEAVQRGDIPSMRIGRRILVPRSRLMRLLDAGDT
jgi:excisionase family DNA binding protein